MRNDGHDSEFSFFFFLAPCHFEYNNNESLVGSQNEISFSELSSTQCDGGGGEDDDDIDSHCECSLFNVLDVFPLGTILLFNDCMPEMLVVFFLLNQVILIEQRTTPKVSVSAR